MSSAYASYPEYRDSGVEWLGEVPSHWMLMQAKHKFVLQRGHDLASDKVIEGEYPVYGSNGPIASHVEFTTKAPSLTVGRSGSVGEINYVNVDFWAHNTSLYLKEYKNCTPRYVFYLLKAIDPKRLSSGSAVGTLDRNNIHHQIVASPSFNESVKITRFLDHETTRIDDLIEKQKLLIKLLKEKRQAVISHAVTKGLNPDVKMRDSGIEWLGEVPEHWMLKRLKHISPKIGVGLVINPSTYTKDQGTYFIFGGDVKEYNFDLSQTRRISQKDSDTLLPSRLSPRDLVSIRVGYPGVTAVVTDELDGANCASVIIIRRGKFNSDWLCAAMNIWVGRQQVELVSYGAAQKQFNVADAVEFKFPTPPAHEQSEIANFVKVTLATFNSLSDKANDQIQLLQERRSALISAAVTGKIDVRNWQAPINSPGIKEAA